MILKRNIYSKLLVLIGLLSIQYVNCFSQNIEELKKRKSEIENSIIEIFNNKYNRKTKKEFN
jgi:hypothetical protein